MSIYEALVLGLIQGLTEFIPVSSSGHLLIAHELFNSSENSLMFDVALHVGTLLALLIYFRKELLNLAKNIFASNKDGKLARLLIIATLPAMFVGLIFGSYIDDNLRSPLIVAFTLSSVGVLMIIVDIISRNNIKRDISTKQGIWIGIAQATALIPGVSRSGATITAGMAVGMTRKQAARFSFLLAVPIIFGSALGTLLNNSNSASIGSTQLLIGIGVAFLSGLLAIKILLGIIEKVGLIPFGIYRIVLGTIVVILLV